MSKIKRILEIIFEKKEAKISSVDENYKPKEEIKEVKEPKTLNRNHKNNYVSVKDVAKHFQLTTNELNEIFQTLNWSRQENKNVTMTHLGKYYGAKECYDNRTKIKSLKWNKSVKSSSQLIKTVTEFKQLHKNNQLFLANKAKN